MAELTAEARRLLRWIDENDCTLSQWQSSGKTSRARTDNWDQHKCAGPTGSIVVSTGTWRNCLDYFEPNPDLAPSMYRLTPAGRKALAEAGERNG